LKPEAEKQIKDFFFNIKNKTSKEIKKIKRLAMKKNIPLKELRKTFCKKCFVPYKNPEIRVKKSIKSITCKECGYVGRFKLKIMIF